MRIEFERTGGFAGLHLAATVESETLPAEEAGVLQSLLDQAGFFSLPGDLAGQAAGADRYTYRLTVADGERQHSVLAADPAVPDELRPLLDWLTGYARSHH